MRFFFLISLVFMTPLFAHVIQTDSFELLEASIPELNQHDLVLFDYDKTLAIPDDALLQSCKKNCLHARILSQASSLSRNQIEELISLILLQRKTSLVDPRSLEVIKALQTKGVKVFVLSALRTGSYGQIPSMEEWRLNELSQLGYDFQNTFPRIKRLDFTEYRRRTHPPVYVQGLLCSGSVPKGEALACFLKRTGFRPRRVIFVDNAADHHDSVEKWVRKQRIPYLGYYYTKGLNERKIVDEQIANFQIHHLIENGEWIDDQEAKRRIEWTNTPT